MRPASRHTATPAAEGMPDRRYRLPRPEGGFQPNELLDVATRITALGGVEIAGVTHFPCVPASPSNGENLTTPNFKTLVNAAETLRAAGFPIEQINAPSANSCDTIPALARGGATHIEPGHAFTGTIPANECGEQPERIAMLYLSEVSHNAGPNSLCFGGGYYRRGRLRNALVFAGDALHETRTLPFKSDNIDYYRAGGQFRGWQPGHHVLSHTDSSPAAT